ncbi:hypothetical protein FRC03_010780 [Tulasnella sp. 419]|nr:hypothetical protein FRC02_010694 [Tulasnella sp. 418]KAG8956497.1 hypothetical protein FRC03_010780 [Tulasnella sp. 419]
MPVIILLAAATIWETIQWRSWLDAGHETSAPTHSDTTEPKKEEKTREVEVIEVLKETKDEMKDSMGPKSKLTLPETPVRQNLLCISSFFTRLITIFFPRPTRDHAIQ